ncbi:hypothetical protein L3Y34_018594 [Caenorhabditis briggsae]|uniref:Major sperm protein n=1 Tax=Caenorhabditis briggsae TaxID=6238 RepID=A0AAE9DNG6_CAEBR|nr:hypothetical protein L3Y34_018594 [Caenorhabditis briggsae]
MAQSVPPGDIQTQPNAKIVFNAPYDDKHTYHIKVINSSARRIGYGIKTTNMKRLGVDPPCGVLDPKEAVLLAVSCDAFAYGQEDTNNDRITVEWTNTPDGAAKQFRREWFQGDGMRSASILILSCSAFICPKFRRRPSSTARWSERSKGFTVLIPYPFGNRNDA